MVRERVDFPPASSTRHEEERPVQAHHPVRARGYIRVVDGLNSNGAVPVCHVQRRWNVSIPSALLLAVRRFLIPHQWNPIGQS